jgi:hypothetical protein
MPNPEEPTVYWPAALYKGGIVDFRRLSDNHNPGVVSFVFRDGQEYGWVTACNPGKGLLIGYRWKTSEYPWLDIWRNVRDGRPAARGLEFGTTGLHQPFGVMMKKGILFGRPLCEWLDAGESTVKSYTMFLAKIPPDCKGVENVRAEGNSLIVTISTNTDAREISL